MKKILDEKSFWVVKKNYNWWQKKVQLVENYNVRQMSYGKKEICQYFQLLSLKKPWQLPFKKTWQKMKINAILTIISYINNSHNQNTWTVWTAWWQWCWWGSERRRGEEQLWRKNRNKGLQDRFIEIYWLVWLLIAKDRIIEILKIEIYKFYRLVPKIEL